MREELDALERNKTWELVSLPQGKKVVGYKWVYKTKFIEKGKVEKHKARLVAKVFYQQPSINYGLESFSPIERLDTVRIVLAIASQNPASAFAAAISKKKAINKFFITCSPIIYVLFIAL